MKQADVNKEVEEFIEQQIVEGQVVQAVWVTHAVVNRHPNVYGEDADWYRLCAYEHIRNTVRQVVQRYKPQIKAPDPQIVMPGFERLQTAYLIERENEAVVVPLSQLTDMEIETKAAEIEAMALGCLQHAKELRRYVQQRAA